ncbi:MAG: FHA domain-containing protein, partial [Tannerella sp.]|nr:FHA domain-containing protein [Tannerella sp.]
WIEHGWKCADYGRTCKHGKQFLYASSQPFSATHRPSYTQWALYGVAGGLGSWLIFHLTMYFFPAPFSPLTKWLLSVFGGDSAPVALEAFYPKIGALFVAGILLGLILVLIFSVLNKYRQRKKDSDLLIALRSLTGAVFVFIAFLLSAMILILCKADSTNILIDWIPWALAGCAMGAVLFFRTNTVIKHIVPGLVLSGLLCFLILLTGSLFGIYSVVFGLMAFGAGAGISFISARKIIHKYYLKFKGEKDEKIAIHKWMSVAGGSNDVSIGSSPDATIRMTWDTHPSVKDIHVRLFFDKKNRLPCIRILANDVSYNGVFAKNNDEYLLKNGVKFTIGNTVFQYMEDE